MRQETVVSGGLNVFFHSGGMEHGIIAFLF